MIEIRPASGRWEAVAGLPGGALVRDRRLRECLFGHGGALQVDRPLFGARGIPEDASDAVPEEDEPIHGHAYATWAEVAAVDWDAPVCDGPAANHVGEWRPGPDGRLGFRAVRTLPDELIDAAGELFGEDLWPYEWPPGGEVVLDGAVFPPVTFTARMFAPPDEEPWAPVWTAMRGRAAVHGPENVRLVVWFG